MKSTRWLTRGMLAALLVGSVALAGCKKGDSNSGTAGGTLATPPVEGAAQAAKAGDTTQEKATAPEPGKVEPDPGNDSPDTAAAGPTPTNGAQKRGKAPKSGSKPVVRSTETHVVTVKPSAGAKSGSFTVTLQPKPGWKINQDFPTSLQITAPAGVKLPKSKLAKGDAATFSEKSAVFNVKFDSDSGAKKFSALFKFAMCTEESCDPKKEQLAWSVNVN